MKKKQLITIKRVLLGGIATLALIVCALSLPGASVLAAADIAINESNFPDPAFRAYVTEQLDTNKDGNLSEAEIALAKILLLSKKDIASLQGVEFFTALNVLYCSENSLTTLDLSKNTELTMIFCDENKLTSIDVSKCAELKALHCFENRLTSLDVSNNAKLEMLRCSGNLLTSLDVSKNKNLTALDCSDNQLAALDVSKNPNLSSLTCFGNQLKGAGDITGLNKNVTTDLYLEPKPTLPLSTQPQPTPAQPTTPTQPITPAVSGPPQNAIPTAATVLVNGKQIFFDAYNINGNNFFKLRDIATVLTGSPKQFEIGWDGEANAIALTSKRPYTPVGGEMASRGTENKQALPTTSRIYLDSVEVQFTAFNISGNNYFKLRDIGQTFDFGVDWDEATFTVIIDTSKGYTE